MNPHTDATHDPGLESWVESANAPDCDFPIQNLPLGRFRRSADEAWRLGMAIGDQVLDLRAAGLVAHADMNRLMAQGTAARRALRQQASAGLRRGSAAQAAWQACLLPQSDVDMGVPCEIGDYTDFYAGIHHATAVGKLFRPDNPLLPNYKWVPIGYHGRASTIGVSTPGLGQTFRRPVGQTKAPEREAPDFGPSRRLDYELEIAAFVSRPNEAGEPIAYRRCRRAPVRARVVQRLECTRHPGLGVPAAGALPVEELRQHAVAVDRDDGGAGAVPQGLCPPRRRSLTAALPRRRR
jgi:fumarylacetoacetase